jgi:two-component system response regulator QseB
VRLLLVEDDLSLGSGIQAGLGLSQHTVDWVTDGEAADRALQQEHFDVMVLDLGLPRRHGLEVLKDMRARGDDTPVLVLTALDSVADRINGLDAGGDDYMTKPFDLDELSARVRALYRRRRDHRLAVLRHGPIQLEVAARRVTLAGEPVSLTPQQFALLRLLLENIGQILPRRRLEEALYGWNADIESNTIEVHIHFLRKKLGENLIRTVRGTGYVIDRID